MRSSCIILCLLATILCQLHQVSASAYASAPPVCQATDTRGGGGGAACDDYGIDRKTRDVVLRFLDPYFQRSMAEKDQSYHIHGWRWHFLSLVRDSERLERLAKRILSKNNNNSSSEDLDTDLVALEQAADYVINFNMAGLYRIQTNLSSKWLRDHICVEDAIRKIEDGVSDASDEAAALKRLVDILDEYRAQSQKDGKALYEKTKKASNSSKSHQQKKQILHEISQSCTQLSNQISTMRNLHESLIVPAISRIVPNKTQKSFSNKVLLSLGILESRLHLVGMHDAVWESGLEDEKKKFDTEIPYVARVMIERWRQSLYLPKAGVLDYGLESAV